MVVIILFLPCNYIYTILLILYFTLAYLVTGKTHLLEILGKTPRPTNELLMAICSKVPFLAFPVESSNNIGIDFLLASSDEVLLNV